MGGLRRYLELQAQAKTGLTAGVVVWALVAVVLGTVTFGFVLAAAFIFLAERFALEHLAIDDAFFTRLREHFADAEILDLTICVADYLAFGRLTQVLKLDQECSIDPG